MARALAGRWLADALVGTLVAPVCACCATVLDTPTTSPICPECWRRLERFTPPICADCGEPRSTDGVHAACPLAYSPLAMARSLGPYEGTLRSVIHAIKYDQRRSLTAGLAGPLAVASAAALDGADGLVPVPLHPWRAWTRGFNQAEDLARALGRESTRVWPVLRRVRATRPQSALVAGERRENVTGAFGLAALTRRGRRRLAGRIGGRVLVLVDDVMTTGATLEACASVLLEAGAREVRAVTLARTVRYGR